MIFFFNTKVFLYQFLLVYTFVLLLSIVANVLWGDEHIIVNTANDINIINEHKRNSIYKQWILLNRPRAWASDLLLQENFVYGSSSNRLLLWGYISEKLMSRIKIKWCWLVSCKNRLDIGECYYLSMFRLHYTTDKYYTLAGKTTNKMRAKENKIFLLTCLPRVSSEVKLWYFSFDSKDGK